MRQLSLHYFLKGWFALKLAATRNLLKGRLAYRTHLTGLQCYLVCATCIIIFPSIVFIKAKIFFYLESFLKRKDSVNYFWFYFFFPWTQLFGAFFTHLYLCLCVLFYEVFAFLPGIEVHLFYVFLWSFCMVNHILFVRIIVIGIRECVVISRFILVVFWVFKGFANGERFIRGKLFLDLVLEWPFELNNFLLLLGEGSDILLNLLLEIVELTIDGYFELLNKAHI